jgi:hypothetical protein
MLPITRLPLRVARGGDAGAPQHRLRLDHAQMPRVNVRAVRARGAEPATRVRVVLHGRGRVRGARLALDAALATTALVVPTRRNQTRGSQPHHHSPSKPGAPEVPKLRRLGICPVQNVRLAPGPTELTCPQGTVVRTGLDPVPDVRLAQVNFAGTKEGVSGRPGGIGADVGPNGGGLAAVEQTDMAVRLRKVRISLKKINPAQPRRARLRTRMTSPTQANHLPQTLAQHEGNHSPSRRCKPRSRQRRPKLSDGRPTHPCMNLLPLATACN